MWTCRAFENRLGAAGDAAAGPCGKLGKLSGSGKFVDWRMLFSLRLAFVLCRRRADVKLPEIEVSQRSDALDEGFEVRLPKVWIDANPLVEYSLAQESGRMGARGQALQGGVRLIRQAFAQPAKKGDPVPGVAFFHADEMCRFDRGSRRGFGRGLSRG